MAHSLPTPGGEQPMHTCAHERPWESRNGARKADRQTCGLQRSRDEHDARKEWSLSCDSLREAGNEDCTAPAQKKARLGHHSGNPCLRHPN